MSEAGGDGAVVRRIEEWIESPGSGSFEELALQAFAFQFARIEPYRRLCEARGVTPQSIGGWREIPAVPAAAFRSLELSAAPAVETFRSSGTTGGAGGGAGGGQRSVHRHPFPHLYRRTIDVAFPRFCLPAADREARRPVLSLIPAREQAPDSSLAFMAARVIERFGSPESAVAFGPRGVEVPRARSWAAGRQRAGRPVLVLATAFALAQWLEALERQDLRFRLPAGSVVFETGGFKGRTREVSRQELLAGLQERLGVPPGQVVREYGMTELTSQCYTRVLEGGDPDLFVAPPWVRVRVLDPESLREAAPGPTPSPPGLVEVFDLANLGSAIRLVTEDLGVAEGEGFRLMGRAAGAELRGCSLTVEELQAGSQAGPLRPS